MFRKKRGIALLDVDVVVVSSAIEHFTCSCLCLVCVAGRYCFRLIAAVVVDFFLLLFTHTHTCRSFSFPLILLPKKKNKGKYFYSLHIYIYIRINFNSFYIFSYILCYNSSFPSFLTSILFVAYLFFLLIKTFFYFLSFCASFFTRKLTQLFIKCHHIYKKKKL